MIFKQTFDPKSSTFTYLLADETTHEAVLIDPVKELVPRQMALLDEFGLKLVYALDTHAHADHVTGSGELRRLLGARTVVARLAGAPCADIQVSDGDVIRFGGHAIEVRETPGHTEGCLTYVVRHQARTLAFTGDALLVDGCGRTDFQGGNARQLYHSVHDKIYSLPDDTLVYPGHDYHGRTQSTVGAEKATNRRLNLNITEEQFVSIMDELDLPNPRMIDIAVPANLACGQLQTETPQ
jgi:sulfur dioxygenase